MNSLLNVALREKRGLVYSVEATSQFMSDTGLFTIYFGCDPEDEARCMRIVNTTLQKLLDAPPSGTALQRAIRQYAGQMVLSHDSTEQTALGAVRAVMYFGSAWSLEQSLDKIRSISAEDMRQAAQMMLSGPFSRLTMR